jgi:hypothetical protein
MQGRHHQKGLVARHQLGGRAIISGNDLVIVRHALPPKFVWQLSARQPSHANGSAAITGISAGRFRSRPETPRHGSHQPRTVECTRRSLECSKRVQVEMIGRRIEQRGHRGGVGVSADHRHQPRPRRSGAPPAPNSGLRDPPWIPPPGAPLKARVSEHVSREDRPRQRHRCRTLWICSLSARGK